MFFGYGCGRNTNTATRVFNFDNTTGNDGLASTRLIPRFEDVVLRDLE